ncbi:MAG: hypothetical protein ABIP51_21670 [Bacteroidia bacterium]
MKKLFFSLSFLFSLSISFAQQSDDFFYYQTCYNISKVNKLDEQVEKYFKLKGEVQPKDQMYYYDMALYYLDQKKNYPKAYEYMAIAIQHGLSFEMTRNFEINDFDEVHQKLIQKNFLNDRNKTIRYFYVNGTGDLMKFQFVRDMFIAEQTAFSQMDFSDHKSKTLSNYARYVDSLNVDTLVKFIKKFGMINTSNVGGDCFHTILFPNLKCYNNSYLDSCIKDNCNKRLLHPSFYIGSIDQLENRGAVLYGVDRVTDNTVFSDVKNIDKLRNEIGMISLYEQSLYEQFKLPKEYIIPENLAKKYEKFLEEVKKLKAQK